MAVTHVPVIQATLCRMEFVKVNKLVYLIFLLFNKNMKKYDMYLRLYYATLYIDKYKDYYCVRRANINILMFEHILILKNIKFCNSDRK